MLNITKYFVEQVVDIHQRNKLGETLLHAVAKFHSLKIIKYFIGLGDDALAVDNQNNMTLLSTFNCNIHIMNLEGWKYLEKVFKYFIWINANHQNSSGKDVLIIGTWKECGIYQIYYIVNVVMTH